MPKKTKKAAIESWVDPSHNKFRAWAGLPTINPDYFKYVKCVWCDMEVLIDSLYGEPGHLKNKHHLRNLYHIMRRTRIKLTVLKILMIIK